MTEKIYGADKPSYGVTERADGWIELRGYHDNKEVRAKLRKHINHPSELLEHYAAYSGSSIGAKRWLAEVMRDYGSHFGENRVQIILNPSVLLVSGTAPPLGPAVPRSAEDTT